jgi:shikimate dehydrogenase
MTDKYAVFGNPIEHSKSPPIHRLFAKQFDLDLDYQKILSTPEAFESDVKRFFSDGGRGCNVTVPFKEQAFEMCDTLTDAARTAKAVNTLYLDSDASLCGHNSDGAGLVNDLCKNHQVTLKDSNIVIVGAGGATRGILEPLILQQPASITIANRTLAKAHQLAGEFEPLFNIFSTGTDLSGHKGAADLLINATSASLSSQVPIDNPDIISAETFCYDLAYASEPTSFLQWTAQNGAASSIDGRGMLIEQAAVSFTAWTGLQPDTAPVIDWIATI